MVKKCFLALLGYLIAGFFVPNLWPFLASPFGTFAGIVGAVCLIFPAWYLVHYLGLVKTSFDECSVDMGLAIGISVLVRDTFRYGLTALESSLLSLVLLALGAIIGGYLAYRFEDFLEKRRTKHDHE